MARTKDYPGHLQLRKGKSGASYRWIFKHEGREYSETIQNTRGVSARLFESQAKEYARTRAATIKENAARMRMGLPAEMRVSQLLDQFEDKELPHRAPGTIRSYRMRLDEIRTYFVDVLGDPDVRNVRRLHVRGYSDWRRARSRTPKRSETIAESTLRSEGAIISAVFSYAVEELELIEANPAQSRRRRGKVAPVLTREPYLLTPGELESLLRELEGDPMAWTYALTLAETGLRDNSEGLRLRWPDLHFDKGDIRVASLGDGHRTKSGRSRTVPMSARLAQALREHAARFRLAVYPDPDPFASPSLAAELGRLASADRKAVAALLKPVYNDGMNAKVLQDRARDRLPGVPVEERRQLWQLAYLTYRNALGESGALPGRRSEWVFHHRTPARRAVPGDPITKSLSSAVMSAAKRAGIPTGQRGGFVPHDLRHRAISLWVLEGLPLSLVMERAGHAKITTTQIYTHVSQDYRARLLGEVDGSTSLLRVASSA